MSRNNVHFTLWNSDYSVTPQNVHKYASLLRLLQQSNAKLIFDSLSSRTCLRSSTAFSDEDVNLRRRVTRLGHLNGLLSTRIIPTSILKCWSDAWLKGTLADVKYFIICSSISPFVTLAEVIVVPDRLAGLKYDEISDICDWDFFFSSGQRWRWLIKELVVAWLLRLTWSKVRRQCRQYIRGSWDVRWIHSP